MVDWKKITRQHKVHTDLRRGWLVSYLVIFCVPLAAYLLISAVTLGIIRNQTYDLNEQALHVISVAVDHQVQSVEEMATEISANTILNEILSMEQETAQHEWQQPFDSYAAAQPAAIRWGAQGDDLYPACSAEVLAGGRE